MELAEQGQQRKRRLFEAMTANACNECRQKRAKCDGNQPCSRCASRKGLICTYDPHLKTVKKDLKAEIDRLRAERRMTDRILEALAKDKDTDLILSQLRTGHSVETIATQFLTSPSEEAQLTSPTNLQSQNIAYIDDANVASASDSASGPTEVERQSNATSARNTPVRTWGHEVSADAMREVTRLSPGVYEQMGLDSKPPEGRRVPSASWTRITTEDNVVDHLLGLYFCWEYPTFASLSKEHFMADFRRGIPRFCSSLLVNAILALGARFSDLPFNGRKDLYDARTAGQPYFDEAKRLLGNEEMPSLTTIQALGLMSLRQASYGNDASSWHYTRQSMRMAIDLDLHLDEPVLAFSLNDPITQAEREVRAATFWGCFNLEQAWSLCIGRMSQIDLKDIEIKKPMIISEVEEEPWRAYTDDGLASERMAHQPSNIRAVYKSFSELSELIHEGLKLVNAKGKFPQSTDVLAVYKNYLEWYEGLPDQLRLGLNSTPTVLFTHMYYHFAILLLFRQFWNLNIFESSTFPRTVCSEAAQNMFVLIRSYKDLYTLRRTPSFVPYIILTATLAYVADLKHEQIGNSTRYITYGSEGLNLLHEMCTSHFFARRSVEIIKFFVKRWDLRIPESELLPPPRQHFDDEDQDNVALAFPQAATYFRPHTGSEHHNVPDQRGSILPTLFSPFDAQGRAGNPDSSARGQALDEGQRRRLRRYGFESVPAEYQLWYSLPTVFLQDVFSSVNTGQ